MAARSFAAFLRGLLNISKECMLLCVATDRKVCRGRRCVWILDSGFWILDSGRRYNIRDMVVEYRDKLKIEDVQKRGSTVP